MALQTFEKQPAEKFMISGSIYKRQETSETVNLSSSSVAAVDKDGSDVTSTVLDSGTKALASDSRGGSNNMLKIRCQAGTENASPYQITYTLVTSLGNTFELDVRMDVKAL